MTLLFDNPYEEERPWGKFVKFTENEPSTVKIITVNPGEAFSLQYHRHRDELWIALSGEGSIEIGGQKFEVLPGKHYLVKKNTEHRVTGGKTPVIFLEVSMGEFDEGDIVRIEDRYGRT